MGAVPTLLAIAGLVFAVAVAETVGGALESASAKGGPLSAACPDASPAVDDPVDPLTPREAEQAAPPAAVAPALRSFDHRTLTPLRPSLKRARSGDRFEITGSRATGSLAAGPAGSVELDDVLCMVPMRTTSAETRARVVGGDSALRANSGPDTDTIIRPTASGVAIVQSRRGPEAPTSFGWKVGLREGVELRRVAQVSATAVDSDGSAAEANLISTEPDELTLTSAPDAEAATLTIKAKRKKRKRRKRRPPRRVKAYPLVGINANLSTEAANAACAFARSQPRGKRLMLINFGQAHIEGQTGALGAGRRPFHSNQDVLAALNAAAREYRRAACHRPGRRMQIAYGVTNYKLSATGNGGHQLSRRLAKRLGKAQLKVARRVKRRKKDGAAVAGDLEPRWDPGRPGVAVGKALARGANTGRLTYYNFGTAGHCPPYPGRCRGWRPKVLGDISQKHGAVALPQIYHAFQARQWARVRRAWDRRHSTRRHCRRHRSGSCFSFAGALSQPRACGAQLTPARSWRHLWRMNRNGSVGRELILYNPRRRNC